MQPYLLALGIGTRLTVLGRRALHGEVPMPSPCLEHHYENSRVLLTCCARVIEWNPL